jgi:hypothetical protein
MTILFGLLLIAHGLVHAGLTPAPIPNNPELKPGAFFTASSRSWLLPQIGLNAPTVRWIGIVLVALSTLGFVLAGLGVLGVPGLTLVWRTLAIVSSCLSLLLLILFWHPWIIVGALIDIVILITLVWFKWTP